MFDLKGKNALVTGGSRGIGRGIAIALATQGANVAINYVANEDKAEDVVREIKMLGSESFAVRADVSNKTQVKTMFGAIKETWEKIDILVNNAGILSYADFENITEEDWDKTINTNLKGQFLCAQQAVKIMKPNKWGRIINIASIASGGKGIGFPKLTHYTASKAGVIGLTTNMALELGQYGICVNAIAPGAIETDMTSDMDEKTKAGMLTRIPKGRIGKPKDIGAAAAFLATDEADYITGNVLYVDGGWLTN